MNFSPQWLTRLLQYVCIAIAVTIYIEMVVVMARIGPPPVPLDTEGHMDPIGPIQPDILLTHRNSLRYRSRTMQPTNLSPSTAS